MGEEKRFLQLGGLGGLLAGILPIVSLILAVSLGFTGPGTTEELLRRFQDFGRAYLIFPGLSLAASLFAITLFLGLHRASRTVSPVAALLGASLGAAGALFAAANWATIMIGAPFLADLHAAATAGDKPTILIAAQAWEQVVHGFQFFGGLLMGLAFVSFGWGLRARSDVQKGFAWASLVLGLLIVISWLSLAGIGGETGPVIAFLFIAGFGMFALFLIMGWKVYSLSRAA